MLPCVLNDLQQSSHVYGFSPVCERMWIDNALFVGKPLPHVSQPYSFRRGVAPPTGVIGVTEVDPPMLSRIFSAIGDSSANFMDKEEGSSFKDKPRPLSGAHSISSFWLQD